MKNIEITDIDQPELNIYTGISERQLMTINEPDPGIFIAESFKVLERALCAGYEPVSSIVEKDCLDEFYQLSQKTALQFAPDFPVYTAAGNVLDSITGYHLTGGCLCAMKRKPVVSPFKILQGSRRIVILENVMNPTNIGAIFRSAAALGMDAVLLTKSCCDPLYRRAIRVSMGTVFQIPWTYIDFWDIDADPGNTSGTKVSPVSQAQTQASSRHSFISWPKEGIPLLHDYDYKLASMALRNESVSISDPRLKSEEKLAILMGSEGEGLLPETIEESDYVIKIPMFHEVDSLNVAAASALAFWELH